MGLKLLISSMLVALVLSSSSIAFNLVDYNYLHQISPSASWLYLFPGQSCEGIEAIELPTELHSGEKMQRVFFYAQQARLHSVEAASYASLQKQVLPFLVPAVISAPTEPAVASVPIAAYLSLSYKCFDEEAHAMKSASQAVQELSLVLDASAIELNKAVSPRYTGFAGGVMEEWLEVSKDVPAQDTEGEGFGKDFVRQASNSQSVANRLNNGGASAMEAFEAVNSLAGKESLLWRGLSLNKRLQDGLSELLAEYAELEQDEREQEFFLTESLSQVESEGLSKIGENAFELVGAGNAIYAQYSIGSFEQDFNEIQLLKNGAGFYAGEAKKIFNKQEAGYAGEAIVLLRSATANLTQGRDLLSDIDVRSISLEEQLRVRLLQERSNTRNKIDSIKAVNAYAASRAESLFEENIDAMVNALPKRGDRIAFYLREIRELLDIQLIAGQSVVAQDELTSLQASVNSLRETISKAAKDGLDVSFEKLELEKLDETLSSTLPQPQNRVILMQVGASAAELEEGLYAKAVEKYGFLEDEFEFVSSFEKVFDDSAQKKFTQVSLFFNVFGELRVKQFLGELKSAEEQTLALKLDIELKLPKLLKQHLQETASVVKNEGVFELGKKGEVRLEIRLQNSLPVSYDKPIALELPELTNALENSPQLLEASESIILDSNGLFLNSVTEGSEYSASIVYEKILAVFKSEREETLYANLEQAEKKLVVNYQANGAGLLSVSRTLNESVELVYADKGDSNAEQEDGQTILTSIVNAEKGDGSVTFTYYLSNPISVDKAFTAVDGGVKIDYSFANKNSRLDNPKLRVQEDVGCEITKAVVSTNMPFEQDVHGRVFVGVFKPKKLEAREKTSASVSVTCSAIASTVDGKKEELEASLEGLSESARKEVEQKLLEANEQKNLGEYEKSLAILLDAQELVDEDYAKQLNHDQARLKYVSEEELLSNELQEAQDNDALREELFKELSDAIEGINQARALFEANDFENALEKLRAVKQTWNTALKKYVEKELSSFNCKECSQSVVDAFALSRKQLVLNNLLDSAITAAKATELQAIEKREASEGTLLKKSLAAEYMIVKENYLQAENAFNNAFYVPAEQASKRGRNPEYQEGKNAREKAQRRLNKLDSLLLTENGLEKISASELSNLVSDLKSFTVVLEDKTEQIKQDAEKELQESIARAKQFGGEESNAVVDSAQKLLSEGKYYSALATVQELNKKLVGPLPDVSNAAGFQDAWLLVVGVVLLGALLYTINGFNKKPGNELKEI